MERKYTPDLFSTLKKKAARPHTRGFSRSSFEIR